MCSEGERVTSTVLNGKRRGDNSYLSASGARGAICFDGKPSDAPKGIVNGSALAWLETFALGFQVQPVTPAIAWKAACYTFAHRDPCDRHILATADSLALPLVTVDRALTASAATAGVKVVW